MKLVFLWADERDKILEKAFYSKSPTHPATEKDATRWSAYGMNIQVPEALPLQHCLVKPAFAELIFAQEKKPERLLVQRLCMVQHWLEEPLDAWLRRQVPAKIVQHITIEPHSLHGDRLVLHGDYKPKGLLLANADYTSVAWIAPEDGRLYLLERITRNPPEALPLLLQNLRPWAASAALQSSETC